MKIEELFEIIGNRINQNLQEQILFESFSQLKNLYDEIVPKSSPRINDFQLEIENQAKTINFKSTHPVDIFNFLVKNNATIIDMRGNEISRHSDVNYWVSKFSEIKKGDTPPAASNSAKEFLMEFLDVVYFSLKHFKEKREFKENKDNYDVLYKGNGWVLFEPHHKAASCKLGSNTKWCISSKSTNYFDQYKDDFDIYMIHTRSDKYAIIVNGLNGQIEEIQDSGNERGDPSPQEIKGFFSMLEDEGVDLDVLFNKTTIDPDKYNEYFGLIDVQIDGKNIGNDYRQEYSIGFILQDDSGDEFVIELDFFSVDALDGERYYFSDYNTDGFFMRVLQTAFFKEAKANNIQLEHEIDTETIEDVIFDEFQRSGLDTTNLWSSKGIEKLRERIENED